MKRPKQQMRAEIKNKFSPTFVGSRILAPLSVP